MTDASSRELPWFTQGILEIDIAGRQGETPFVRWGDAFVVAVASLVLAVASRWRAGSRASREALVRSPCPLSAFRQPLPPSAPSTVAASQARPHNPRLSP